MKKWINLIGYVLVILMVLVGCSVKSSDSMMSLGDSAPQMEVLGEESKAEALMPQGDKQQGAGDTIQFNTTIQLNRKIIKTGNMDIETKRFDETIAELIKQVEVLGGFLQNATIEGYVGDGRTAQLTVRIPSGKFDGFMNDTDRYGNVLRKSIEGQDVTEQYVDTEIRLSTLEIQAERLKELLKQAGDLQDLFAIEQELSRVTYEMESLKGSLKKYDSLIDYATVTVYVSEAKVYSKPDPITFGEKIKTRFIESIQGVLGILKNSVLFLVGLVPFLIILIPCGIGVWFIIKHVNKKRKK